MGLWPHSPESRIVRMLSSKDAIELRLGADRHGLLPQAVDENRVIAMFVCSARQQALHGPSHEQ